MTPSAIAFDVSADFAPYNAALAELADGLEAGDALERFDRGLLRDLFDCIHRGAIGELTELVHVPAPGTEKLAVEIQPGGLLKRAVAALRALRDKSDVHGHEGLPSSGIEDWPPDSKRGERLS